MMILAIYNDNERRLEVVSDENMLDEYESELDCMGYAVYEFTSMQKIFDANANKTCGMERYTIYELMDFAKENSLI